MSSERKVININSDWVVLPYGKNGETVVDLPFSWDVSDGQSGGKYYRGAVWLEKEFESPELSDGQTVYLEFNGVNSVAEVWLNGKLLTVHKGGYAPFRVCIKDFLEATNVLRVKADNSKFDDVYPQTADFTFFGGIYRDVNIIVLNENHFDLDFYGSHGIKIEPTVLGDDGQVTVTCFIRGDGIAEVEISDADGKVVATGASGEPLVVGKAHLWNGVEDPYLYTARAVLYSGGRAVDEVTLPFGFRTFGIDVKKGFLLNGKAYPLKGVSKHQDRKDRGYAVTHAALDDDMAIMKELGANAVRLAHYEHDDYFYDLCDRNGIIVWTEIPVISEYLPRGDDNAMQQMRELVYGKHHHASICFWGIANEITMFRANKRDRLRLLDRLNEFCKSVDPSRITTLACYSVCPFLDRTAHVTDAVGWNLYFGWYVPGKFLNKLWLKLFSLFCPKRPICFSEYGAEGMPNLHSERPRRGDNSEEYQLEYHEYMLEFFARNDRPFATYVWNMFDFASNARNQGGEAGINHKGLVTYDRAIKKDAFYIYKAFWSTTPFVHICGKRFVNRHKKRIKIKIVTNLDDINVTVNGNPIKAEKSGMHSFDVKIALDKTAVVKAFSGDVSNECTFVRVDKPDMSYKLRSKSDMHSWQK